MKPLVSILIPAYNSELWIADTISSALQQTWTNKEILIVDDGSIDQTLKIAQRFSSHQVSIVSQENQGAAAARNRALLHAQGEYIQWLDADDLISPAKIESQMKIAETLASPRTLLSCGWGSFIYRTKRTKFRPTQLWQDLSPEEWLMQKWECNSHMQTATWLTSRELTNATGPWDSRLLSDDDGEYFSRAIIKSNGVRFCHDSKVHYRSTPSSRLSNIGKSNAKKDAMWLGMTLQIGYLLSINDTPRSRAACVSYLQTWLYHFYPERPDLVGKAQELAIQLGGDLGVPRMSWKYDWIRRTMGWTAAKNARDTYNSFKFLLACTWDKTLFRHDAKS